MKSFVECLHGLMGGGKSFYAVSRMCNHIADGGVVYSNIKLQLDPWFNDSYDMPEFLLPECFDGVKVEYFGDLALPCFKDTPEGRKWVYNSRGAKHLLRLLKWDYDVAASKFGQGQYHYLPDELVGPDLPHHLPKGTVSRPVLCILDEALDHFESDSSTKTNAEFRSFLRHIRKLGVNLIFIAQDFSSLEKKIRVLVHYVSTFKDLKFWKVPVLGSFLPGGVLPPPWCNRIHHRQFHAKQFGMAKAEPINRIQFLARDPLIFQCYQSVSLHNAKIQMGGKAQDYGSSGRIILERKRVSTKERIIIYCLLVVALFGAFRKRPVSPAVVAPVSVAAPAPKVEPPRDGFQRNEKGEIIEKLPLSWVFSGETVRIYLEGQLVEPGLVMSRGLVESVSLSSIKFKGFDGKSRWVYNLPSGSRVASN